MNKSIATFAAGCFHDTVPAFTGVRGILKVTPGFTGGQVPPTSPEAVLTGKTGHAEAVEIEYDPESIDYTSLLDIFFDSHDPTSFNQQGPLRGAQFRSAIFAHSEKQRQLALEAKQLLDRSQLYTRPIVTEVLYAMPFYPMTGDHQHS